MKYDLKVDETENDYIESNIIALDSNAELNHFHVKIFSDEDKSIVRWERNGHDETYEGTVKECIEFIEDTFLILDSYV